MGRGLRGSLGEAEGRVGWGPQSAASREAPSLNVPHQLSGAALGTWEESRPGLMCLQRVGTRDTGRV